MHSTFPGAPADRCRLIDAFAWPALAFLSFASLLISASHFIVQAGGLAVIVTVIAVHLPRPTSHASIVYSIAPAPSIAFAFTHWHVHQTLPSSDAINGIVGMALRRYTPWSEHDPAVLVDILLPFVALILATGTVTYYTFSSSLSFGPPPISARQHALLATPPSVVKVATAGLSPSAGLTADVTRKQVVMAQARAFRLRDGVSLTSCAGNDKASVGSSRVGLQASEAALNQSVAGLAV